MWDMVALAHVTGNLAPVDVRVIVVERLAVSPADPEPWALAFAADVLLRGGLVVFPTDTLYGLACDPRNADAVERVYRTKGRLTGQAFPRALPLVAASLQQVEAVAVRLSPLTRRLADCFWPGPLTLVVDVGPGIVEAVHAGLGTVAVRVPNHAVARGLAAHAGFPIVSTSANRSQQPATSTVETAIDALGDLIDLALDGGPTVGGAPSTIVDVRTDVPHLLREGAVPFSRVLESL
jgi:L-threonylcarbamoyladenylate synthase